VIDNLAQTGNTILEPGHSVTLFIVGIMRVPRLEAREGLGTCSQYRAKEDSSSFALGGFELLGNHI